MSDKMTIKINVIPTPDPNDDPGAMQTVSQFSIDPKGQVTFTNAATKAATVEFGNPSPICQGNTDVPSFSLGANGGSKTYKICKNSGLFKYTATVIDAAPEDPILIVEKSFTAGLDKKPIFFPEGIPMLLIGGLLGAVIGYLVAKRLLTRSPRPT